MNNLGNKWDENQGSCNITEVSHVVQVRAEGPKAPSPGHRPG